MTSVILDLVDSAGRAIAGRIAFTPTYDGIAGGPPYDATPIEADLVDPPETVTLLPSSQVGPYEVRARRSLGGGIVFSGLLNIPEAGNYSLNALLELRKAAVADTKQFVSSVNGLTGDVTIPAGGGAGSKTLPFSEELVFDAGIVIYQRANAASGLAFSANLAGAIPGSTVVLGLLATGGTAPDFSEFKALTGSSGWDNRSGITNLVMVYYLGSAGIWYTISQEEGQVPIDISAPTLVSAAIPNAAPSTVVLTFSEALATRATPTSAFAISGRTITTFSQSGSTVTLTVSTPFVFGNTATLSYTPPGANPLADVAGNTVAAISASAITNNVASATPVPLTFPVGNRLNVTVTGTAPNLEYASTAGTTAWNSRMRSTESIPAGQDGWVMVRQATLGGTVNIGLTEVPGTTGDLYTSATMRGVHLHPGGNYWAGATDLAVAGAANDSFRVRRTAGVITAERRPNGSSTWTTFHTFPGISTAQLWANITLTFATTSVARDVQGVGFS